MQVVITYFGTFEPYVQSQSCIKHQHGEWLLEILSL